MSDPVPLRRRRLSCAALRLLLCGVALTGLVAMHGLAEHTAVDHQVHTGVVSTAAPAVAHAIAVTPTAASDSMSAVSHSMNMVGLCLAVLTEAGIVLLLLTSRRAVALTPMRARLIRATRATGRRDRDPPSLFALSVLRT